MYKTEFKFEDMIVEVECEDVDEYNVYGHNLTFVMEEDSGKRFEVEADLDFDAMQEVEETAHEKLLEAKMYPDLCKVMS